MNKTWERNTAGLMAHARSRKETKRKRVEETITALLREHKAVNFNAVATAAGVSKAYLYSQPQLRERIEALRHQELEQKVRERATPSAGKTDASMAQHRLDNLIEHITGTENRYLLFEGGKGVQRCVPDSPDWFAWLTQLNSFHFQGKSGHFTARQERKQRGATYWYAYRKAFGKQHKRYLGSTDTLTLTKLEEMADALLE